MSKKNLILGGVLVVLIVFAYVQQGPWQEWRKNIGKPKNFLASVDVNNIRGLEIIQGTSTVSLEKEDQGWKIGGTKDFYTSSMLAGALNEALDDLVKSELEVVSKNKNNKKEFATDESGIGIKIFSADDEYDLIVGNTGPTVSNSYISRLDDNKTYLINTNIRNTFIQDEWRDDQIFSFMPERIKKVRFQYQKREFTVEKIENVWQGVSPSKFAVLEEKITDILKVIGNLKAHKIPEQTFEGTGLEKHSIIIEVTNTLNSYVIMVGGQDEDGNYYVKKGSSDNIYLITEEEKEALDINISDLK